MAEDQSSSPRPRTATPKPNRSCDACRTRKVKCPIDPGSNGPCANCLRRKAVCHFGPRKPSRRRNVNTALTTSNPLPPSQPPSADVGPSPAAQEQGQCNVVLSAHPEAHLTVDPASNTSFGGESHSHAHEIPSPKLYVDHLLSQAQHPENPRSNHNVFIRGNGIIGAYNITFFSDARLDSLSGRLGNNSVHELVGRISNVVRSRLSKRPDSGQNLNPNLMNRSQPVEIFMDKVAAKRYIDLYFERLHPLLPFLDRSAFEDTALDSSLDDVLANSKPWVCLYHAVLALGSQYDGEGSFEPGSGKSWKLFSVALASFPDLLLQNDSLLTLQAMTAMAAYALSCSCLAIEHVIISEAARRAQNLAGASFTGRAAHMYHRSFWVLYAIEKMSSFQIGRSSVFVDEDISCPIPSVPEAIFGGFDYLLSFLRCARIISKALTLLFCVGVANKPTSYHLETSEQLKAELEDWRLSLPDTGFRPEGVRRPESVQGIVQRQAALFIQYLHAHMSMVINRNILFHLSRSNSPSLFYRHHAAATAIHKCCRLIIELTILIEVKPHTNIWILATIPLAALFVLFDIVVHNPRQPEAHSNLALLDMAAGHFSRIEYYSSGNLPATLVSEFAHIARSYVNSVHGQDPSPELKKRRLEGSSSAATQQAAAYVQNTVINDSGGAEVDVESRIDTDSTADAPPSTQLFEEFGGLDYTFDTFGDNFPVESSLGTNVLSLFNYSIPELDPFMYQSVPAAGFDLGVPYAANERVP